MSLRGTSLRITKLSGFLRSPNGWLITATSSLSLKEKKIELNPEEKFAVALSDVMSPDARIRNVAAITLMDSGNPKAVDALVAAIEIAAYREARGTLIYALSSFDCTSRFSQIFRWAIEGGFEASHEALAILREQRMSPDEMARKECLTLLDRAQKQMELDNDLQEELLSLL